MSNEYRISQTLVDEQNGFMAELAIVNEEYNAAGQVTRRDYSDGYWVKWTYNEDGVLICWENSKGKIVYQHNFW